MTVNIEKMRADLKWEARKFLLQIVVAVIAALGVGVAIGSWIRARNPRPRSS